MGNLRESTGSFCHNHIKVILKVSVTMSSDCFGLQLWLHPQVIVTMFRSCKRVYKLGLLNIGIIKSIVFPLFIGAAGKQQSKTDCTWLETPLMCTHAALAHEVLLSISKVSHGICFTSGVGHLYSCCILNYQGLTGSLEFLGEFSVL